MRQIFIWVCSPKQMRSGLQLDGSRPTLLLVLVPIPKLSIDSALCVSKSRRGRRKDFQRCTSIRRPRCHPAKESWGWWTWRSQSWPKSFLRCNQLSSYLQFSMRTAGLPRDVTFLRSKKVSFSNSLELLFTIFPMFPALPLGTGCSQRCHQLSRQDGNSLALYVFSTQ